MKSESAAYIRNLTVCPPLEAAQEHGAMVHSLPTAPKLPPAPAWGGSTQRRATPANKPWGGVAYLRVRLIFGPTR